MTKPRYRILERISRDQYPATCYVVEKPDGGLVRDDFGKVILWATKGSARERVRELGGVVAKPAKAEGKP